MAPPPRPRLPDLLSPNNARLASARRLTSRKERRETGRFLAEGAQAVREALAADAVVELFATAGAIHDHPELVDGASEISIKDAAALSETVTPQGLVAVCRKVDVPLEQALGRRPRLLAVLVEANDPGNAGSILRTADAAGADAVLFAGDSVDVYNGKLVRASAGSLFHLELVTGLDPAAVIGACRAAGLRTLATTGAGSRQLDELIDAGELAEPTAWLFGNEARGLPNSVLQSADETVRVPIYGAAESLNLAAAAALCLYGSARAQRAG